MERGKWHKKKRSHSKISLTPRKVRFGKARRPSSPPLPSWLSPRGATPLVSETPPSLCRKSSSSDGLHRVKARAKDGAKSKSSTLKRNLEESFDCLLRLINDSNVEEYDKTLKSVYIKYTNHVSNKASSDSDLETIRHHQLRITDYEHCITLYNCLVSCLPTHEKAYQSINRRLTTYGYHRKNILSSKSGSFNEELDSSIKKVVNLSERLLGELEMHEDMETKIYKTIKAIYEKLPNVDANTVQLQTRKTIDEIDAWRIVYNQIKAENPKPFRSIIKMHQHNIITRHETEQSELKKHRENDLKSIVRKLYQSNEKHVESDMRASPLQDILCRHFDMSDSYHNNLWEKIKLLDTFYTINNIETLNYFNIMELLISIIIDKNELRQRVIDLIPAFDGNCKLSLSETTLDATLDTAISELATLTRNQLFKNDPFIRMLSYLNNDSTNYEMAISRLLAIEQHHYNHYLQLTHSAPLSLCEKPFGNIGNIYKNLATLSSKQIHHIKALELIENLWLLNAILFATASNLKSFSPPNLYFLHNDNAHLCASTDVAQAYLTDKFSHYHHDLEDMVKASLRQHADIEEPINFAYAYFEKHRPHNLRNKNRDIISLEITPFICQYNALYFHQSYQQFRGDRKPIPKALVWFLDYLNLVSPEKCQAMLSVDAALPASENFMHILDTSCNTLSTDPSLASLSSKPQEAEIGLEQFIDEVLDTPIIPSSLSAIQKDPEIMRLSEYVEEMLMDFRHIQVENDPFSLLKKIMTLVKQWACSDIANENKSTLTEKIKNELTNFSTRYSDTYDEDPGNDPETLKSAIKNTVKEQLRCKKTDTDTELLTMVFAFIDHDNKHKTVDVLPVSTSEKPNNALDPIIKSHSDSIVEYHATKPLPTSSL